MFLQLLLFIIPLSYSIPICSDDLNKILSRSTRIPRNIIPRKYSLSYEFDVKLTAFNGNVEIEFVVDKATDLIILYSRVNITSFDVKRSDDKKYSSVRVVVGCSVVNTRIIILKLSRLLSINETGKISISFNDKISKSLNGIFETNYITVTGERRKIVSTYFEPNFAHYAFPCFDEPSFKAVYVLTLNYSREYNSLSNTNPDIIIISNEYISVKYNPTPIMSTYLLGFAIMHNYREITNYSKSGVKISVWLPDDIIQQGRFALEVASQAFEYFEKLLSMPYSLEKLDFIGIPESLYGAEENWGLITVKLTSLVVKSDDKYEPEKQKLVARIIVHELAHQWVGNLVTMEWWNELWLKEGFARYMEYRITDLLFPQWNIFKELSFLINSAILFDETRESHAISVPLDDDVYINSMNGIIFYDKAASILHMLFTMIGDTNFFDIIKTLLFKYQYGNIDSRKFLQVIEDVTHNILYREMMTQWSANIGFPLVTIEHVSESQYIIYQERMLVTSSDALKQENSESNTIWTIPIRYHTLPNTNDDEMILLTDRKHTYNLSSNDIKLNYNHNYFYRVNYGAKTWLKLGEHLLSHRNSFSNIDRLSLVSDIFTMNTINRVNISTLLEFISFMPYEDDKRVLLEMINKLENIHQLILEYPTIIEKFEQYILSLVNQIYDNTLLDRSLDSRLERSLQLAVLSMNINCKNPSAVSKMNEIFNKFLQDTSSVNEDDYLTYFSGCVSLYHATETEWLDILELYKKSTNYLEKEILIFSLTCIKNKDILKMYLELSLNQSVIEEYYQEVVLTGIASNTHGFDIAWQHVKSHWTYYTLRKNYYIKLFKGFIIFFGERMKTQAQLDDLKNFLISKSVDLSEFDQLFDNIGVKINWIENNINTLDEWLNKKII